MTQMCRLSLALRNFIGERDQIPDEQDINSFFKPITTKQSWCPKLILITSTSINQYKVLFESMKILISLLAFFLTISIGFSQDKKDIVIGSTVIIDSKVLDQERALNIYLPSGYENSSKEYPVLYLLDGQTWFNYGVSINQLMTSYGYLPEFIIVGIETSDAPRFGFFANAEKLLTFLSQDVLTYVDKTYRTNSDRMLFGWQFAGAFTLEAMIQQPDLFEAYFAASPIPINEKRREGFSELLQKNRALDKTLFLATSLNENGVETDVRLLAGLLEKNAPASLNWKYEVMENESLPAFGHRTTPLGTLYQGLRRHYHDYPLPEFNSIEDFEQAGGYDYVQSYYEVRANKYGLPKAIPQEGMFFLVRLGMDEDHFPTFKRYMNDFMKTDFLDNINLGWSTRYAQFYLKHKDPNGAKIIFAQLIERFPDNPAPVNGLGDVYRMEGNLKEARKHYVKAISLAEKSNDSRLDEYKKDLNELGR